MKVYFYHTQDLNYIYDEWKAGRFPSHLLYGACELKDEGIEVVMHKHTNPKLSRLRRIMDVTRKILFCKEKFDAVYATKHNGLDFIILLRALGLFRKPIITWHHQPIEPKRGFLKRMVAKLYYRGIDHMFMFSDNILESSVASGIVSRKKLQQCPWGADLAFYDRLMADNPIEHKDFISTGKEQRDMPTLIEAFAGNKDQRLQIIAPQECCGMNYEQLFAVSDIPENVDILINRTMWIRELAMKIWPFKCICICCKETNYTVGLTTLVEALAFGIPVIISKNSNQPFDASEEGCGISVAYGDVEGWKKAIRTIADNPEVVAQMSLRSRQMAEQTYNIRNCARIVAERLKAF